MLTMLMTFAKSALQLFCYENADERFHLLGLYVVVASEVHTSCVTAVAQQGLATNRINKLQHASGTALTTQPACA